MAEVTQNTHVSQEDQLKAMSYISEERREHRIIYFPKTTEKRAILPMERNGINWISVLTCKSIS